MTPIAGFLRSVINDAGLAADLQACGDVKQFIEFAHSRAVDGGLDLTREDFQAALLAADPRDSAFRMEEVPASTGWLPEGVTWRDRDAAVHWRYLGTRRLSEPFFSETMRATLREPFSRFLRPVTSIEALERSAGTRPGLPLIGLIAHVSRCGSTLVSQMLACLPGLIVASEAPPFDAVLREGPPDLDRSIRIRRLRAMVHALGQPRTGGETGLILKLDSWHLSYLSLVREAFPETPIAILYRDPAAVLASQMREPGLHMAGVLRGLPFDGIPFVGISQLEFRARILGGIFEAAARWKGDALFLAYADLPGAVLTSLVPFFGIQADSVTLERMKTAAVRDAKSPGMAFAARASDGLNAAQQRELVETAEGWCGESYRALERRRDVARGV